MKISERYLSSKINYNKGDFEGIAWENWEVVINFLAGNKPDIEAKTFKRDCGSLVEAKKLESQALKIIRLAIIDPDNDFFKEQIIKIQN